ncbi:MAG: MarR family transcriptional regulator, partial [Balneolaceae bacterium]
LFANRIKEEIDPLPLGNKKIVLESLLNIIYSLQRADIISVDRMCYQCRYFLRSNDPGQPHYCRLLETSLTKSDLRIDCPEFEYIKDD